MPHHRSLLKFFRQSCIALTLASGLATVAGADDTGEHGGTTPGKEETGRRQERLPSAASGAVTERSVGVVPQLSPIVTAERWQPLLNEISRRAGVALRFATASSITKFEERAARGEYDYVYLNALLFRQTLKSRGYRALVRDEKPLQGILAVRHDGPKSLDELSGKTLAFPSPRAFGATLLTRANLRRLNIPHTMRYLGTHESVYQSVVQGQYVAGGGVQRSFDMLPEAQRRGLRILHTTAPMPSHVIAVHERVPSEEVDNVREVLQHLHEEPEAARAMAQLELRRLVEVIDADFDALGNYFFEQRPRELALHVIPQLDVNAARQQMQPLASYMKQQLDLDVGLKTYSDMETFEKAIYAADTPSLINANPLQALRLIKQGFEVVAQQVSVNSPDGMRSVILVRADSPYRRIEDLKGKPIAFGDTGATFIANSLAKTMLRRAGLKGQYIEAFRPGPLSNFFSPLVGGQVEAAVTSSFVLHNQTLRTRYIDGRLRVLTQSEPLPGFSWLVGPRLDPAIRDEIRHFLLDFGADIPGYTTLRIADIEQRLVAADNTVYDVVRPYLENTGD